MGHRKLEHPKLAAPTITMRAKEEGEHPQRADNANVLAVVAESVEQGESRYTYLVGH